MDEVRPIMPLRAAAGPAHEPVHRAAAEVDYEQAHRDEEDERVAEIGDAARDDEIAHAGTIALPVEIVALALLDEGREDGEDNEYHKERDGELHRSEKLVDRLHSEGPLRDQDRNDLVDRVA